METGTCTAPLILYAAARPVASNCWACVTFHFLGMRCTPRLHVTFAALSPLRVAR
jgi:hypothetical protein